MSALKCLFIFYNLFSLQLTENLHKQKHDLHVLFISVFCKVDNKKRIYHHTVPLRTAWMKKSFLLLQTPPPHL